MEKQNEINEKIKQIDEILKNTGKKYLFVTFDNQKIAMKWKNKDMILQQNFIASIVDVYISSKTQTFEDIQKTCASMALLLIEQENVKKMKETIEKEEIKCTSMFI